MTIYVKTGHPLAALGEVLQETHDFQRKAHATAEPHAPRPPLTPSPR